MLRRFQALIAAVAHVRSASSFSVKDCRTCPYTSSLRARDLFRCLSPLPSTRAPLAPIRVIGRLLPSVKSIQSLLILAGGAQVFPVHVNAERTSVDLRSAQAD